MSLSRTEIETILRAEVESAYQSFRQKATEFKLVISDVPTGIPHPDGALRIRQYGHDKAEAIRRLRAALERFDGFVLDGRIPPDLVGR